MAADAPRFGPFVLLRKVSMGGTSVVFAARHVGRETGEASGPLVALKRLLPHAQESPEQVKMFASEGALLSRLDHPLIAKVHSVGEVDGSHYLTMDFVHGRTLKAVQTALSKADESCPSDFVAAVGLQAATALAYAHNATGERGPLNIVHRDISPQNLMVTGCGEFKLIDFGIARFDGPRDKTATGVLKGKHAYMSPEQVRGERVDHRSDIFSLGVTLYELVTGRRLFKGDSLIDTLSRVEAAEVVPLSEVAPRESTGSTAEQRATLYAGIMACLARDPLARPAEAASVVDLLSLYGGRSSTEVIAETYGRLFDSEPLGSDLATYQQHLRRLELGEDEGARESSDMTVVADIDAVKAYLAGLKRPSESEETSG